MTGLLDGWMVGWLDGWMERRKDAWNLAKGSGRPLGPRKSLKVKGSRHISRLTMRGSAHLLEQLRPTNIQDIPEVSMTFNLKKRVQNRVLLGKDQIVKRSGDSMSPQRSQRPKTSSGQTSEKPRQAISYFSWPNRTSGSTPSFADSFWRETPKKTKIPIPIHPHR